MAATEEYENQLPVQNTGKHIRALDANGNPILIPIDEMAKVVGELLGNLKLFPFMERLSVDNLNNAIISGTYITSNNTGNIPIPNWSFLCVFANNIYVVQLLYAMDDRLLFIRYSNNKGGSWASWQQI